MNNFEFEGTLERMKMIKRGATFSALWPSDIDNILNALEKQTQKKPILKSGTEVIHLNKGDEPHEWREIKRQDWVCPVCGCFVGEGHNVFQKKPHDQRKCNYCNECGQAIDWEGTE